jgi:hypothetical protein
VQGSGRIPQPISRQHCRNVTPVQNFPDLNRNPLDFIQRDVVARPVVELRRTRRFVRRNRLGVLDRPAVLQVRRDAGRAERVAAGGGGESGFENMANAAPGGRRPRRSLTLGGPIAVSNIRRLL